MRSWRCGGGEEGGEEGGQVQGRDAPRVDCGSYYKHQRILFNISITHVLGESLPESLHGLGGPGQDLRVVRGLLDTERCLEDIVLTSGYAEDLENAPVEVWGRRGRRRGGRATKPVVAAGGLWDELKASAKRMRYLCDARTWRSRPQGRYMAGRAWARFLCCRLLVTE